MYHFNEKRFIKVIDDALGNVSKIEKIVDVLFEKGFKNLFLIGVGGTYSHFLPIQFISGQLSDLPVHAVQAAEFVLQGNKQFSWDSLCVFCSRSGDTQEIVNAIQYCNNAGATTLAFVCHAAPPSAWNRPITSLVLRKMITSPNVFICNCMRFYSGC